MGFTALIDVAIGLTLLYLGAALFVTVANEFISQLFNLRVKQLAGDLETLLGLQQVRSLLPANPALRELDEAAKRSESYADPVVLAQSMIGAVRAQVSGATRTMQELSAAIVALPESQVKNALMTVSQGSASVERFREDLAQWVDRSLKVMGEAYKRKMQTISFWLGVAIAVAFNIDTISLTSRLYNDKDLRERVAASAEAVAKAVPPEVFKKCMELTLQAREQQAECKPLVELQGNIARRDAIAVGLPIGWGGWKALGERFANWPWGTPVSILGWLLTALAISVGAPFWFDLLNRFVNIRHSIRRPEPG